MQPFAPHRLEGTPYRLDSVLGEGAMGEVYLGEHLDLRRPAVIKLIKARYINEGQIVARMRREARIVARIRHDALVTIYDLGTAADGRTYIAMEYVDGTVLRRILQTRGAIPLDEAAKWMAQCCDGLEVAHREGVIHRDIKPENLFVTITGQLKVLDFGVAKPLGDDATSAHTAAGMVLGTPRYMAPEQAFGKSLSGATDVYAAGCVLFELLTGTPVFDAPDAKGLLHAHIASRPPTLSERLRRAVDPRAEAIVARALQKDPAFRFPTAAEMGVALRELASRPSASPRVISVHDKPTIRVDDGRTAVDDVHSKPTIRVDGPAPAQPTDAFPLERRSDPVRVSYVPPGAAPVSAYDETRAIPAMNLVQGVSTTEQQSAATAQTEALNPIHSEVNTAPLERRGTPLWPFAVAFFLLAGVGTALVLVMRGGHEEARAVEQPAAAPIVASAAPAPATIDDPTTATTPTTEPSVPAPLPTAVPAAVKPTGKPTATTTAKATASVAAKPADAAAPPAPSAPSAYDRARQLMNDGDLDAAEREARSAVSTHGNSARLLLGEILERKGKPGLARDVYKKILDNDPNNATAKTRLAKLGG